MKTEEIWKDKAQKFLHRAKYSEGDIRRRTDKVKSDEARAIYQAFGKLDRNTKMVSAIFQRDRRTISSILARAEAERVVNEYRRLGERNQESEQMRLLAEFISEWKAELPLPLNYLSNEDLSIGQVPNPSGGSIIWEYSTGAPVVRRFETEDKSEFELIRKNMPHSKLWQRFRDYKLLCGRIIEECSILMRDMRLQSEKETGLNIAETGELGLDQYFAWTIYADALNIFNENWSANKYYCVGERGDICQLRWGDYTLAIMKQSDRAAVESAHQQLKVKYREGSEVKRILELSVELHKEKQVVRAELDAILQALAKRL